MENEIVLRLPPPLYQRARALANRRHQKLPEMVLDIFAEALPLVEEGENPIIDLTEPDEAMDREMLAYIALHPQLRETHLGQYVAVFQGQVVDQDAQLDKLSARVRARYPQETIWITQVQPEAMPIRRFPSMRMVRND